MSYDPKDRIYKESYKDPNLPEKTDTENTMPGPREQALMALRGMSPTALGRFIGSIPRDVLHEPLYHDAIDIAREKGVDPVGITADEGISVERGVEKVGRVSERDVGGESAMISQSDQAQEKTKDFSSVANQADMFKAQSTGNVHPLESQQTSEDKSQSFGPHSGSMGSFQEQDKSDKERIAKKGMDGPAGPIPYLTILEKAFGRKLGHMKAYSGDKALDASERLNAHAYTHQGRIVLGNRNDLRTVAEETAHALQQSGATRNIQSSGITDVTGSAEMEARNAADAVVSGQMVESLHAGLGEQAIARAEDAALSEKEKYKKEQGHQRAIQTVGQADQALEPPNPNMAQHGHGHAEHGYQTTAQQQTDRIRTGVKPSGEAGAPVSKTSHFTSPEAEAEALGRGRRQLEADIKSGKVDPGYKDGKSVRHEVVVETNRPEGFGAGYAKDKDPVTGKVKKDASQLPLTKADPDALKKAKVVFEFRPSQNDWAPVTYFPIK
jgi:hypothetical protein